MSFAARVPFRAHRAESAITDAHVAVIAESVPIGALGVPLALVAFACGASPDSRAPPARRSVHVVTPLRLFSLAAEVAHGRVLAFGGAATLAVAQAVAVEGPLASFASA